MQLNTSSSAQY